MKKLINFPVTQVSLFYISCQEKSSYLLWSICQIPEYVDNWHKTKIVILIPGIYIYFDRLQLTTIFQFVCPGPKGSKLKNQPVPFRD